MRVKFCLDFSDIIAQHRVVGDPNSVSRAIDREGEKLERITCQLDAFQLDAVKLQRANRTHASWTRPNETRPS